MSSKHTGWASVLFSTIYPHPSNSGMQMLNTYCCVVGSKFIDSMFNLNTAEKAVGWVQIPCVLG